MPELDPHPTNELGKGVFPPEEEAKMIADGVVYATYMDMEGYRVIVAYHRPFIEAVQRLHDKVREYMKMDDEQLRRRMKSLKSRKSTEY